MIKISKIFGDFVPRDSSLAQGLLPSIRHFENRRGEGPGDEVGFRRSTSALCHLLCEATCSLRTDKQLGDNVTSVDEYSKIVTVQQLGDRIMHIMHISRLKYNS